MVTFKQPIPILAIFDEPKTREFYVDFLGFSVDWEHRFQEDFPLYMQVSKGSCILHLTGHHGDACPGAAVRIKTQGLDTFNRSLLEKQYKHARPGIEKTPWETREMSVKDPFGNRLVFYEEMKNDGPPVVGVDSVVFSTRNVSLVREFYLQKLGLRIGTFEKDGRLQADESDTYVNFDCGGVIVGFEKGDEVETGTLVLKVSDLEPSLSLLAGKGVKPVRRAESWAVIQDPEGREIILQK